MTIRICGTLENVSSADLPCVNMRECVGLGYCTNTEANWREVLPDAIPALDDGLAEHAEAGVADELRASLFILI